MDAEPFEERIKIFSPLFKIEFTVYIRSSQTGLKHNFVEKVWFFIVHFRIM